MLGLPFSRTARGALASVIVVVSALLSTPAAADPPPDLPPLPGSGVTPPTSGEAPVAPARAAPAPAPGPLPTFYPLPQPGTGEVPPGYAVPYYFAPYMMPQVVRPAPLEIPPLPPRRRHSPGLMAGGIVMVAAGVGLVALGAVLVSSSADRIDIYCDTNPPSVCAHEDDASRKTGGALVMAAGALAAAGGIPLWLIGSKMELVPKAANGGPSPEVRVGAGTASLVVRF